jgi:hypothetical protein
MKEANLNRGLRFAFGWMVVVAAIGCGGESAPNTVDQEIYDDVISMTEPSELSSPNYTQCVHGGAYWSAYNKYASDPAKQIGWPRDPWTIKDLEDRLLCGQTLHAISTSSWNGTAWHALAQAWIPAYLNLKNGAQFGPGSDVAFHQAFQLVMSCNVTAQEPAKTLAQTLKTWSAGGNGPAACVW